MAKGKLYIVPIGISEASLNNVLPDYNTTIVKELRCFVVEKLKTSRQFLRKMDREFPIDDTLFFEQNKHDDYSFEASVIDQLKNGVDVGLMSESGYAGIADPGAKIVANAHKIGVDVIPLIGPSSIFLALAASGMNANGFTFHGYLPKKDPERGHQIKSVSNQVSKLGYAQIFIETPYRNELIFKDFLRLGNGEHKLCIAYDITGPKEKIQTKRISDWKSKPFKFDKTPCVFVIGN